MTINHCIFFLAAVFLLASDGRASVIRESELTTTDRPEESGLTTPMALEDGESTTLASRRKRSVDYTVTEAELATTTTMEFAAKTEQEQTTTVATTEGAEKSSKADGGESTEKFVVITPAMSQETTSVETSTSEKKRKNKDKKRKRPEQQDSDESDKNDSDDESDDD